MCVCLYVYAYLYIYIYIYIVWSLINSYLGWFGCKCVRWTDQHRAWARDIWASHPVSASASRFPLLAVGSLLLGSSFPRQWLWSFAADGGGFVGCSFALPIVLEPTFVRAWCRAHGEVPGHPIFCEPDPRQADRSRKAIPREIHWR